MAGMLRNQWPTSAEWAQNKYFDKTEGKDMLLRVIGKESPKGFVLITAYKTSKIEKYWMKEEL